MGNEFLKHYFIGIDIDREATNHFVLDGKKRTLCRHETESCVEGHSYHEQGSDAWYNDMGNQILDRYKGTDPEAVLNLFIQPIYF